MDYYLTTSRYMRLSDQRQAYLWQLSADRLRRSYTDVIKPGDSAVVQLDLQAIPGGPAEAYRVFGEISNFYSGSTVLEDPVRGPTKTRATTSSLMTRATCRLPRTRTTAISPSLRPAPPRWSLGFAKSGWGDAELARGYRRRSDGNLPLVR